MTGHQGSFGGRNHRTWMEEKKQESTKKKKNKRNTHQPTRTKPNNTKKKKKKQKKHNTGGGGGGGGKKSVGGVWGGPKKTKHNVCPNPQPPPPPPQNLGGGGRNSQSLTCCRGRKNRGCLFKEHGGATQKDLGEPCENHFFPLNKRASEKNYHKRGGGYKVLFLAETHGGVSGGCLWGGGRQKLPKKKTYQNSKER